MIKFRLADDGEKQQRRMSEKIKPYLMKRVQLHELHRSN
jgi:hypothetical protein